jgi:hypothetical protein
VSLIASIPAAPGEGVAGVPPGSPFGRPGEALECEGSAAARDAP